MHCFLIKKNKITWIYISRCNKTGFQFVVISKIWIIFYEIGNLVVSQKTFTTLIFLSLLHYLFWSGSDRSVIYLCIIKLWKPGARLTESSSHVVIKQRPKSVKSIKYFQWTYKKYNCGSESPCDAWFCNRLHNLINFPSINLLVEYPAACIPRYSWAVSPTNGARSL